MSTLSRMHHRKINNRKHESAIKICEDKPPTEVQKEKIEGTRQVQLSVGRTQEALGGHCDHF